MPHVLYTNCSLASLNITLPFSARRLAALTDFVIPDNVELLPPIVLQGCITDLFSNIVGHNRHRNLRDQEG